MGGFHWFDRQVFFLPSGKMGDQWETPTIFGGKTSIWCPIVMGKTWTYLWWEYEAIDQSMDIDQFNNQ